MFTTCIHCASDLGRNEAIERFPVGTRLAFDAAKGRLWVVCRQCERWNLSPLEERWEAIEDAERRFRASRLRASTDNIGLARLREGLDLVRVGSALRPEMAAWRYGDQFGRRRKRQMLITGAVLGSATAIVGGVAWLGASVSSFAGVYANGQIWDSLINGRGSKIVARIMGADGVPLIVTRSHARMSVLERTDATEPLWLRLRHKGGEVMLHGDAAARAATRLLPTVNRFGGSTRQVREAVNLLEDSGEPRVFLHRLQAAHGAEASNGLETWITHPRTIAVKKQPGVLHALPVQQRLALEMALHEESERRAMDGELDALEREWREAEQIAKIADDMFVTTSVDAELDRLKHARDHPSE